MPANRYPLNPSMVHPKSESVLRQRLHVGALGYWRNSWDFRCRLSGEWERLIIGVQLSFPEQSEYPLGGGDVRSLAKSKCSFISGGGGHRTLVQTTFLKVINELHTL